MDKSADLIRFASNSARQFAGAIPTLAALSASYSLVDAVLAEFELRRHFEGAQDRVRLARSTKLRLVAPYKRMKRTRQDVL